MVLSVDAVAETSGVKVTDVRPSAATAAVNFDAKLEAPVAFMDSIN